MEEARKEFLKKRPMLKEIGIFLGDDLTVAQVAHMKEKMPEILAAREKGKIAFYRGGKVVILEKQTKWQCEIRGMNLKMAVWNCNGSLKLDVGAFEDSFKGRDIIFYSKTHQDRGGILPKVSGYFWNSLQVGS